MPTIGEVVHNRRVEAGLSREQLAERTGLSKGYIADLEQGRYADLSTSTVKKLREAMPALTCDELLNATTSGETAPRPRGRPKKPAESEPPPAEQHPKKGKRKGG